MTQSESDKVWRALSDPTRRGILDLLAQEPQTTGSIVDAFPQLSRTGVMKHLDLLHDAALIVIRREGRTRWNYINAVPIQRVCDRWVSRHVQQLAGAASRLKDFVENQEQEE